MKTANFPAKRKARQIASQKGGSSHLYLDELAVQQAREERSKKNRSSIKN